MVKAIEIKWGARGNQKLKTLMTKEEHRNFLCSRQCWLLNYQLKKSQPQMKTSEFITKLIAIIQNSPQVLEWGKQGDTIVFKDSQQLAQKILPIYFKHKNLKSFIRQLNMYGFTRISKEDEVLTFKNDIFRKGNQKSFYQIQRTSKSRTFKNANDQFNKQRASFQSLIKSQKIIDGKMKEIFLHFMLYKDQTENTTKQIKNSLKNLLHELEDSRSQHVLKRIEEIKTQSMKLITQSLEKAKDINYLAKLYEDQKGGKEILKEQQIHLNGQVKQNQERMQDSDNINFSQVELNGQITPFNSD